MISDTQDTTMTTIKTIADKVYGFALFMVDAVMQAMLNPFK